MLFRLPPRDEKTAEYMSVSIRMSLAETAVGKDWGVDIGELFDDAGWAGTSAGTEATDAAFWGADDSAVFFSGPNRVEKM
jgi:hypothetical protein